MKPHILFILDYFTPHRGGSETVFQNIITRLHTKGYPITILTSRYDPALPAYEDQEGIHIYRTAKSRLGFMLSALFFARRIFHKEKDIALIHTSTYGGALPASLIGFFFRKKVILTVHEIFAKLWYLYKGRMVGMVYRLFEWVIFQCPYARYHCVSRYTMNALRLVYGIPDRKLRMIYNGVDTSFRNPKQVGEAERKQRRTRHGRE
jgi:glycosyltransferase involved in cell wall biosynthesis